MTNPIKGEVAFEAGGKQFTFVLGTYAQAALQRRTGVPTFKFFRRKLEDWGADDFLALFHAGLLKHHRGITEEEAADLMDDLGNAKVQAIFSEAMALAFPQAEAAKGEDRPQKAKSA
jgi:hypothetical protein